MSNPYFAFLRWLHKFDEFPSYNRFGAGLYQLLWTQWCGYGFRLAWRVACVYWFGKSAKP